mgnify:CR=1 FL=1
MRERALRFTLVLALLASVSIGLTASSVPFKAAITAAPVPLQWSAFELLAAGYSRLFGVVDIRTEQFFAWLRDDRPVLLIDVREPQEQSVSVMPGAIAVGVDTDIAALPAVRAFRAQHAGNQRARIVVYCAAGYRSGRSIARANKAHPAEEEQVPFINLRGGIISYANAGGRLLTPAGQPTQKVHGYNESWSQYLKKPAEPPLPPAVPGA